MSETPSVVLNLETANLRMTEEGVLMGHAIINAVVEDADLWDKIVNQLKHFEVYRGKEFKTEMIEILRNRNESLEVALQKKEINSNEETQRLLQQASVDRAARVKAEQELRLMSTRVLQLEAQLEEVTAALNVFS